MNNKRLVAVKIPIEELKGLSDRELAQYFGQIYSNVKNTLWFKKLKKDVKKLV